MPSSLNQCIMLWHKEILLWTWIENLPLEDSHKTTGVLKRGQEKKED